MQYSLLSAISKMIELSQVEDRTGINICEMGQ